MANTDNSASTVIIRQPTKVKTDGRGRTIWAGRIEELELNLISTQELKLALLTAGAAGLNSIKAVAAGGKDGVVAHDQSTGLYDVISGAELKKLLDSGVELPASLTAGEVARDCSDVGAEDAFSLVNTQALRQMLDQDNSEDSLIAEDNNPGFDPYNKA